MLALRNAVQSFQNLQKNQRIVGADQNIYLQQNFSPQTRTLHQENLQVEGNIPSGLDGAFLRVGPNPYFAPTGGYHWFDGDGMVHAVRLKNGKVSYSNRWVETSRLQQERDAGKPLFGKIGDSIGLAGVAEILLSNIKEPLGILSKRHGQGQANTAMIFHAKRLLALHEADLPYALTVACNGLLETVGRVLDGQVKHPFSAHPKPDPATGDLYFVGYNVEAPPFCWYSGLDPDGHVLFDCPVPLSKGILMHDMQTTEDYAIILDTNLEFDPQMMVRQDTLPFVFNGARPSRFGVIDKRQPKGSREPAHVHHWFELEPMSIFHTLNAWQEGPLIRMYTCYTPQAELTLSDKSPLENITAAKSYLAEFTFNMQTGEAVKRDLAPSIQAEYPKIPKHRQGLPTKYAYVGVRDLAACERTGAPMFGGFAKIELAKLGDEAIAGVLDHGTGKFGSEPFFVPAHPDLSHCDGEDDGYLLTYVHDTSTVGDTGSELVIYSAKTMSSQPVARVPMPQRIPYGFHSEHIPEVQFQQQLEEIPFTSVWPTRGTVPQ